MKIGIIEIMPAGHYTLVNSVAQIYSSDIHNKVTIITTATGKNILLPLVSGQSNITIKEISRPALPELQSILEKLKFDRIYITTLSKYFQIFYAIKFQGQLNIFIHNIDFWFNFNLKRNIYAFLKSAENPKQIPFHFKHNFIYPIWRKKISRLFLENHIKLVVLNQTLKNELSSYYPAKNIEVIPFSIFDINLAKKLSINGMIRICLPGLVSAQRRDYYSFFNLVRYNLDFFRDNIEIDLLGGISKYENGFEIIDEAKQLIEMGIKIYYYNKSTVPVAEFDIELSKAHIVLANFKVNLSKFRSYGKTKDSGAIFTCIHAAKPGLFPSSYPVQGDMKSSILTFDSYEDLVILLKDLISNRNKIEILTDHALENSKKYNPLVILNNLLNVN